jgi:hypothetical protein
MTQTTRSGNQLWLSGTLVLGADMLSVAECCHELSKWQWRDVPRLETRRRRQSKSKTFLVLEHQL